MQSAARHGTRGRGWLRCLRLREARTRVGPRGRGNRPESRPREILRHAGVADRDVIRGEWTVDVKVQREIGHRQLGACLALARDRPRGTRRRVEEVPVHIPRRERPAVEAAYLLTDHLRRVATRVRLRWEIMY